MSDKLHKIKMGILKRSTNPKSILFHIVGLICIVWFLIRVVPKPDRIRYPCQQMSITIASGYITFWVILWSAIFFGLNTWMKKIRYNASKFSPVIVVSIVIIFSVSSNVFADVYDDEVSPTRWDPIPKQPIGTPYGINPGRVVWVWDADATEKELNGYWWEKQNNDQAVIESMFSSGIQSLAGADNDYLAWDYLFKYFNQQHGYGNVGYQPGEKIVIKINMNNAISYENEDNDKDASPYVVKALLRQLVNVAGADQTDIYIFDAQRPLENWFYNRVYYEEYPASPLVPEFTGIHYVDSEGDATGREEALPGAERVYFAAGSCAYRTLPTIVTDAKYFINLPNLKRHPIEYGITLSGKNLFGSWIEAVVPVHDYLSYSFTMGNPAPQTDLLGHESLGGKTFLYLGDGTYATKIDHRTIAKFQMYPFNNDWTNSLFFSQDPVAIDSVMYNFLLAEGTNPTEGSQNYLHQCAVPNQNTYDPENDGTYLSESIGVHEHWDTTEDIFSPERYSGPSNDGIDYIAIHGAGFQVDAHGPYYGLINQQVQFTGSADNGVEPYTWSWNFGDGGNSNQQNPTHVYQNPGNYTVSLTVTDSSYNTSIDTTFAKIKESNNPPNKPTISGPTKGKPGIPYSYKLVTTDLDGDEYLYYYIDWGDDTNTGWIGPYPLGEQITQTHTWSEKGTFNLRYKAKDNYGGECNWGMLSVTIPKSRAIYIPVSKLLENHLNISLIIQILLQKF